MDVEIGSIVEGTVVRVAEYGAIVRLDGGKTGLVHVSEVADAFVRDVRDYINENDRVRVKVLRLNDKGRYELSAKRAGVHNSGRKPDTSCQEAVHISPTFHAALSREFDPARRRPPEPRLTFEDKLSLFMKESEDRQHELKRSMDAKRGVRKR